MSDEIENAEKYIEARLAECLPRPELHRNIIEVYKQYLKIIKERPQDYVREAGDMFAVMRGEQLDRNENLEALHKKFSHAETADAYKARAEAVRASTGYGDIYIKAGEARKATEHLLSIEQSRRDSLAVLCRGIVAWKVAIDSDRSGLKNAVIGSWESLKKLDSDLSWEKLRSHPPYRNSLYYNNEQLSLLEGWFMEIIR